MMNTPKMDAYLASLPEGFQSFPTLKNKASSFMAFVAGLDIAPLVEVLPAELRELILHPPPSTVWIPEVKTVAIYCAAGDVLFAEEGGLAQYRYDVAKKLLSGPLYRLMSKMLSAERALKLSASLWSQFHQGSTMTPFAFTNGETGLRFEYRFPAGSYPEHQLLPMGMSLLASAHLSGSTSATIELTSFDEKSAAYRMPFHDDT